MKINKANQKETHHTINLDNVSTAHAQTVLANPFNSKHHIINIDNVAAAHAETVLDNHSTVSTYCYIQ